MENEIFNGTIAVKISDKALIQSIYSVPLSINSTLEKAQLSFKFTAINISS